MHTFRGWGYGKKCKFVRLIRVMRTGTLKYLLLCFVLLAAPRLVVRSQEADSLRHYNLDNSVVTSSRTQRPLTGLMTGNMTLNVADLDWLPQVLGTADILKTIQLMPGVAASGEMDAGVYVRGADPGQVSVLFDGARIYFPSHLFNFYSVFNSDHLASASVLKSGISPSYGGGASGVIDVKSPDGLCTGISGKLNVGIISSQATVSVSTGDRSSLRISGRGNYVNYLLKNLSLAGGMAQPEYGFYDGNLTWAYRPDDNNSLKLNAYFCKDDLSIKMGGFSLDGDMDWINSAASLTWNRVFGNDVSMNHVAAFSLYDNHIRMHKEDISLRLPSGIMDLAYKGNVVIPFGQSSLMLGADYVYHRTRVQTPLVSGLYDSGYEFMQIPYNTHEFGTYAEWSKWFSFPLRMDLGLRYSGAVTAGLFYGGLEPRLSLSYDFPRNMRLRASLMRQMQYVNTVSVSGMGLPTDFLIPVNDVVKPQTSLTASVGFSHGFMDNMYEYSIEPYWSRLGNVLEFDGQLFDFFGGEYDTTEHVLPGSGLNYGVEFMFKKNAGKVNGWVSYTLSRSLRSFPGIMDGRVFASKHDRPHNLSVVANYSPSDRWTFSTVFIYGTGTPYTPPSGLYMVGESIVQEYGAHNSARMPDYHRLDLSATYDFLKKGRLCHSVNVSIYNVYARRNPLFRDIKPEYDPENTTTLKLNLIGVALYSFLPSVSYNLTF